MITPPSPQQAALTWEQYNHLYTALQNLSMAQQQAGGAQEWFLDTGASSHITGPPNPAHHDEVQ